MSKVLELPVRTVLVRTPDGGLRPSGPAYPFIEAMNRRKRPYDRLVLAVLALRKDEDCIEANLHVARRREHDDDKVLRLYIGSEEGLRLWESGFARAVVGTDLGAVPAARPYLETILELGECLERLDVSDEAREHYEHLLELDPRDSLGARAHLDALDRWRCGCRSVRPPLIGSIMWLGSSIMPLLHWRLYAHRKSERYTG